jgi:hypothetical protein
MTPRPPDPLVQWTRSTPSVRGLPLTGHPLGVMPLP